MDDEKHHLKNWKDLRRKASEEAARDFPGTATTTEFDVSLRVKALEIASQEYMAAGMVDAADVVDRAKIYAAFLSGETAEITTLTSAP